MPDTVAIIESAAGSVDRIVWLKDLVKCLYTSEKHREDAVQLNIFTAQLTALREAVQGCWRYKPNGTCGRLFLGGPSPILCDKCSDRVFRRVFDLLSLPECGGETSAADAQHGAEPRNELYDMPVKHAREFGEAMHIVVHRDKFVPRMDLVPLYASAMATLWRQERAVTIKNAKLRRKIAAARQ